MPITIRDRSLGEHRLDLTDRDAVTGGVKLVGIIPLDSVNLDPRHAPNLHRAPMYDIVRHWWALLKIYGLGLVSGVAHESDWHAGFQVPRQDTPTNLAS